MGPYVCESQYLQERDTAVDFDGDVLNALVVLTEQGAMLFDYMYAQFYTFSLCGVFRIVFFIVCGPVFYLGGYMEQKIS